MAESNFIFITGGIALTFFVIVLLIWYLRFRRTSQRVAGSRQARPQIVSDYRARYGDDSQLGELYVSKERVWFDRAGKTAFDVPASDVAKLVHNKRSVQFVLKNGSTYTLRYLHQAIEKEGAFNYWAMYSVMYNDKDALSDLQNDMRRLGIVTEEGDMGRESSSYYTAIAAAIFSACLILIMLLVQYVF